MEQQKVQSIKTGYTSTQGSAETCSALIVAVQLAALYVKESES